MIRPLSHGTHRGIPPGSAVTPPCRVAFPLNDRRSKHRLSLVRSASLGQVNPDKGQSCPDKLLKKRLAVFVSGGGSNFRSIHKATLDGTVLGDISLVVSDKPECKACEYAKENEIPLAFYPHGKSAPNAVPPNELLNILRQHRVDYVLLAGYLKLIPKELVEAYPRAILNIHPALLPAFGGKGFYGMKVHQAVISSGARVSGPTIHFVDEKYDHGRILAQKTVPVLADDTPERLASRVLLKEHEIYVEAVAALCEDRIEWREDGVPLIRKLQSVEFY